MIPKASTIWLKNSSNPIIGSLLKVTELLTWHNGPYLFNPYLLIIKIHFSIGIIFFEHIQLINQKIDILHLFQNLEN